MTFLSTPSARRATGSLAFFQAGDVDFYPRPPRGGRRLTRILSSDFDYFYPRPPRGGRLTPQPKMTVKADFYPRPPRGGRRREVRIFQRWYQISIHALREEGDGCSISCIAASGISIHALREEGDAHIYIDPIFPIEPFLSTPSARRATRLQRSMALQLRFLSTPSARRATCGRQIAKKW